MIVAVGTRLGPYEITAKLGEGGMGEVYRATDSKLKREVAIKVLPAAFAEDKERLARFEREAQLLAQLHHPNIASIFGLEESNGVRGLVMELVEGEELSAIIARGPLAVAEALPIARQIAEALEAAHERGIVHRDLKPANVKVQVGGTVKVLDFGLAKAMDAPDATGSAADLARSPTLMNSPTLTGLRGTELGVILGTAAYMSPEQARGRAVDKRADLWALGVVLYEMLSGRGLFGGETASDTMAAVLRQAVDWDALPRATPPEVRRLLARLLERDTRNRLHDAADARLMLQDAISGRGDRETAPAAVRRSGSSLALVAAGVAAAVAAFAIGRGVRSPAAPSRAPRPVAFHQLTDAPGVESSPTLSPDGKSVVYVARVAGGAQKLFLLRVGGRNATALDSGSPASDWQPAFSPDGETLAFRSERDGGGVFLMGSTGESVRRLTDFGFNPTWSPDGKEIVVANGTYLFPSDRASKVGGLVAIAVDGGARRVVSQAADAMQPRYSPHGKRIAFWGLRGDSGQRDLFTVAADGSDPRGGIVDVTNDAPLDWSPTWSPDGRWLWFSSNRGGSMNLWRVPIDETSGRVLGEPEPMTTPSLWAGEMSFSADGTKVAYTSLLWRSTLLRAELDAQNERVLGLPAPVLKSTQPIRDHQVSPDGQWVAYMQTTDQEDLVVARLDGTEYRRLTEDRFRDRGPAWSPDGKEIAFYSDRSGSYQVWAIRPDGSGLRQVAKTDGAANLPIYSPDGQYISVSLVWTQGGPAWLVLDGRAEHAAAPRRITIPQFDGTSFWPTSWTSDSTRVVGIVVRRDGTAREIAVYTLATGQVDVIPVGEDPFWKWPQWLPDGRRLLLRDARGISVFDTVTHRSRLLVDVGGYFVGASLNLARDGKSFTYTETGTEGDLWVAELK